MRVLFVYSRCVLGCMFFSMRPRMHIPFDAFFVLLDVLFLYIVAICWELGGGDVYFLQFLDLILFCPALPCLAEFSVCQRCGLPSLLSSRRILKLGLQIIIIIIMHHVWYDKFGGESMRMRDTHISSTYVRTTACNASTLLHQACKH
ncbi:uncharacterized protein EDB91DRAFT_53318 [Suillus paluster]|uniref:uncharacterized protein n=1 Tax=Suillus paluster TaxID=48578 RepID=UPI001B86B903|nr:uncharacterized protein EDB91DRAFT_53318 [Suillus paluster]KAG1747992.1 hypothetical protein EDB91DRAFT_53318 [Suillus paluster]